jgi:hypothetical protein
MNRILFALFILTAIMIIPSGVLAAEVIIVNIDDGIGTSSSAGGIGSTASDNYRIAFSFAINSTGYNVTHIDTKLRRTDGTNSRDIYVAVENDTYGHPLSNTTSFSNLPIEGCNALIPSFLTGTFDWKNFTFPNCQLQKDKMYWLVFNTSSAALIKDQYITEKNTTQTYVNGNAAWWATYATAWTAMEQEINVRIWGNTGSSPTITSKLNITLFNGWNTSYVDTYSVTLANSTTSFLRSTTSSDIFFNSSEMTTGETNITISKSGYENVTFGTYNFNFSQMTNLSLYTVADNDMIHIVKPMNNTYFSTNVDMDIHLPVNFGNIFNIKYNVNSSATNVSLNTTSGIYAGVQPFSYSANFLVLYASNNSMFKREFNKSVNFLVSFSRFNINVYDEMTGRNLVKTPGSNWTISLQCDSYINQTEMLSNTFINYTIPCTGSEMKITINDTYGAQYRVLTPPMNAGNLSFFMINRTTSAALQQNFILDDIGGLWAGALVTFKKPVPLFSGKQKLMEQTVDAERKIVSYMIDGEKYEVTVTKGSKTISISIIASSKNTQVKIGVTSFNLDDDTSSVFKKISYGYTWTKNVALVFTYKDATNTTNFVSIVAYNDSNLTDVFFTNTQYGTNDTTITIPIPTNMSMKTVVTISTSSYGVINEVRYWYWSTGKMLIDLGFGDISLYYILANMMIICFALIFTAYDASIGGILTLFLAGMLYIFGWLHPSVMGGLIAMVIIIFALHFRNMERGY